MVRSNDKKNNDNDPIIEAVHRYRAAGLQVIPIRTDGSKAPAVRSWKEFQDPVKSCPDESFIGKGIAILGGWVSGGLEVIDFDVPSYYTLWCELLEDAQPGLLQRLVIVNTPRRDAAGNPGVHVYYRCDQPESSAKLAYSTADQVAIETRGEGGYVLAPGCPPSCHPTGRTYEVLAGRLTDLPYITMDERTALFNAARALSKYTETADHGEADHKDNGHATAGGESPGDVYAKATSWAEILTPHHWKPAGTDKWTRPGKDKGTSATTCCKSKAGRDLLYVFSSSAHPFGSEKTYSKFATYAILNHSGDYSAAAKELAKQGYGVRNEKPATFDRRRLEPGTKVRATDRDNFGEVVSDDGDTISVHFVGHDGNEATKHFAPEGLRFADGSRVQPDPSKCYKPDFLTSAQFASAKFELPYLIEGVIAQYAPMVIAGRSKTLKTSTMIDAAISMGTGTKFLGRFSAVQSRVLVLSGESGQAAIQRTARAVCETKGVNLADADVLWGFDLPSIASPEDLAALAEVVTGKAEQYPGGVDAVIVDPAYLCLMGESTKGLQASNLFDMGPLLFGLSRWARATRTTVILLHHCRKWSNGTNPWQPPELEDMSMAGFAEWARQWILIGRRAQYEHGSGRHELWLSVGGSAGHSGLWGVTIDEGEPDTRQPKRWDVEVMTPHESKEAATRDKEKRATRKREKTEAEQLARVRKTLKQHPEGLSRSRLKDLAAIRRDSLADILLDLTSAGKVTSTYGKVGRTKCEIFQATDKL